MCGSIRHSRESLSRTWVGWCWSADKKQVWAGGGWDGMAALTRKRWVGWRRSGEKKCLGQEVGVGWYGSAEKEASRQKGRKRLAGWWWRWRWRGGAGAPSFLYPTLPLSPACSASPGHYASLRQRTDRRCHTSTPPHLPPPLCAAPCESTSPQSAASPLSTTTPPLSHFRPLPNPASPRSAGNANSCDSMKGRLRSHSGGGRGPHVSEERSRTPVYSSTGMPVSSSIAAHLGRGKREGGVSAAPLLPPPRPPPPPEGEEGWEEGKCDRGRAGGCAPGRRERTC
eukprot:352712-Chlamydomonas_euryale.AAC.17